jgi:aryl-alcohol dehydrogenase-like predicted oxidoreductase
MTGLVNLAAHAEGHEKMKKIQELGKSGLNIGPLAFGGNVFGWTADEATSFRLLDSCLDAGINFIDTADVYTIWIPGHKGGESETVIGSWLKKSGKREKVIIASKVGMDMQAGGKGLSRSHIRKSIEGSLKRLQTDYIDLYQSHEDDKSVPLQETLSTYAELIKEGKIRAIGASNYSAERLAHALTVAKRENLPRYESLQPLYNLYDRSFEKDLEALCLSEKIGVIPYFPLASGFLTGKYRSEADLGKSPRGFIMKDWLNPRGHRILDALDEVAKAKKTSSACVALAWLMARPSISAPIVSTSNLDQFKDTMAALTLDLDQAAIQRLDEASA